MTDTIKGKIYGGPWTKGFWDCGEVEAYLAPKLNAFQYAFAVSPDKRNKVLPPIYVVYFCAVRSTGNMEWMSFCDATKTFRTSGEAHDYARRAAAECRYMADAPAGPLAMTKAPEPQG